MSGRRASRISRSFGYNHSLTRSAHRATIPAPFAKGAGMQTLIPTLWRTCRVLANPQRLNCLRAVSRRPGLCVSDLAKDTGERVGVTSQYLRDLQARGLIAARRWSRWTFYDPVADSSVGHASVVLTAALRAIEKEAYPYIFATAAFAVFAHPRRLQILWVLRLDGVSGLSAIRRQTGISERALLRHLPVLAAVGVVKKDADGWKRAAHSTALLQTLVRETCR